jgi:hypothetical protein
MRKCPANLKMKVLQGFKKGSSWALSNRAVTMYEDMLTLPDKNGGGRAGGG